MLLRCLPALMLGFVVLRFNAVSAPRETVALAPEQAEALLALDAAERAADEQQWSSVLAAFRYEDQITRLVPLLNREPSTWTNLGAFASLPVRYPAAPAGELLRAKIRRSLVVSTNGELQLAGTLGNLTATAQAQGWRLDRVSLRQIGFETNSNQRPRSTLAFSVSLSQTASETRLQLRGKAEVIWQNKFSSPAMNQPASVNIIRLERLERSGPPAFREWFATELPPQAGSFFIDPLLARDLDGDGRTELCLLGAGRVARLPAGKSAWALESAPWSTPPASQRAVIFADINGDGWEDLLIADHEGLLLIRGEGAGRFAENPTRIWRAPARLEEPQVLSVGDVDRDGRLDIFFGQYRVPYVGGQFPTPYYDANDGLPFYLLHNDGDGSFTDITGASGLAAKRHRRVYSASLFDWDQDGDADLIVMSDFAGIDLFRNDAGRFIDVTAQLGESRHLFGMGHAIADFDGNGTPDVLAVGMDSPVATLLDRLAANRPGFPHHARMRAAMTFGNRVFLGDGRGGFAPAAWSDEIAKAGWAWGAAVADFENSGALDIYLANGHETLANYADYERQFWLHDIYVGRSEPDHARDLFFFAGARSRRLAAKESFGGWQENKLFLQAGAQKFIETAFVLGVALPEDCRNVIAADFDGDGRVDLAVTTVELTPRQRQRLLIYRNELPDTGHWIGFRFTGATGRAANARVRIGTKCGTQTRWLVTGDGFRSQNDLVAHFGLSAETALTRTEIVLFNGEQIEIPPPQVDHWNTVLLPPPEKTKRHDAISK
ncbi:MAG: CRTAC1 family protein [Verrucomicrobia bacterium]|nr:CRTAC1 family protein [Verrucomicrobiota bacterium]